MIRRIKISATDAHTVVARALICCQNPALNPMQIAAAVTKYLPDFYPDFVKCRRVEIFDLNENIFR